MHYAETSVILSVCFRYRKLDKLLHVGACNKTNEIELLHTKKKFRFVRNLMPKIDDHFHEKIQTPHVLLIFTTSTVKSLI